MHNSTNTDQTTATGSETVTRTVLDGDATQGSLWAGLLAGTAITLSIGSLFYKPLLLGMVAAFFIAFGALGEGTGDRIAKVGMPIVATLVFFGMVLAIFVLETPLW